MLEERSGHSRCSSTRPAALCSRLCTPPSRRCLASRLSVRGPCGGGCERQKRRGRRLLARVSRSPRPRRRGPAAGRDLVEQRATRLPSIRESRRANHRRRRASNSRQQCHIVVSSIRGAGDGLHPAPGEARLPRRGIAFRGRGFPLRGRLTSPSRILRQLQHRVNGLRNALPPFLGVTGACRARRNVPVSGETSAAWASVQECPPREAADSEVSLPVRARQLRLAYSPNSPKSTATHGWSPTTQAS
jgi:hypothetical protein